MGAILDMVFRLSGFVLSVWRFQYGSFTRSSSA